MSNLKMNCGYCGRKCSLDKDFCIPQDSVYICKSCYDWKQKVDNLEAKLAESENKVYELQTKLNIKEYAPAFCSLAGRDCETLGKVDQLKQQLAETDKLMQEYLSKCLSLEQQLAEKEKEIEELKTTNNRLYEKNQKLTNKIVEDNLNYYKRGAIDELEKVKEYIVTDEKDMFGMPYLKKPDYILDFIDQQINDLRSK